MPSNDISGRGTNSQGNRYDTRTDSAGNTGYHYSNQNGSYYYANPGIGFAKYTSLSGQSTNYYGNNAGGGGGNGKSSKLFKCFH
ncbi:hypothetical protein IAT38_000169 [Cryptococcus sp. DSM 104549]